MINTLGRNIIPDNDRERLDALDYYNILNNIPDRYFSNLAHIIRETFNTPIALISLVSEKEVHFTGNAGMEEINKVSRGDSLCSIAIMESTPIVFTDTLKEPCLLKNPNVAGSFGLRFYAGAPITTPGGFNIGTVCIIDKEPRDFSADEKKLLITFAENAMKEIEARSSILS